MLHVQYVGVNQFLVSFLNIVVDQLRDRASIVAEDIFIWSLGPKCSVNLVFILRLSRKHPEKNALDRSLPG